MSAASSSRTPSIRGYVRPAGSKFKHWLEVDGQDVGKQGQRLATRRYQYAICRWVTLAGGGRKQLHAVRFTSQAMRRDRVDESGDFPVRIEDAPTAPTGQRTQRPQRMRQAAAQPTQAAADRIPHVTRSTRPEKGNYYIGSQLYRVCGFPEHTGDRHLKADKFYTRKSGPRAGLPVDICVDCLTKRSKEYGAEVQAAKRRAADIRLTAPQRQLLADLPPVTARNRRMYRKLEDVGAVAVTDDQATRTQLGRQLLNGGQS